MSRDAFRPVSVESRGRSSKSMTRDTFRSVGVESRSRSGKNWRKLQTVIFSRRNPWPFASILLCGSIATMPRSVRSFSWIKMPGFIHCTSMSIFSNARPVHSHNPNILGLDLAKTRAGVMGLDWFKKSPPFFPIGNARRPARLRGGWMQSDSQSTSGKRPFQTNSADSSAPAAKTSKKGAKPQLIDVDANGAELSRRDKGPGRVASGYTKRANGNWYKTVVEANTSQRASDAPAPAAPPDAAVSESNATGAELDVLKMGEDVGADEGALFSAAAQPSHAADGDVDDAPRREGEEASDVNTQRGGGDGGGWTQQGEGFTVSMEQSLRGNLLPRSEACWDPAPREWVVFSDLHVSRSSLPTCLEVLERVHEEARQRGAGVIFLGDFWHEKGILRIEPLNAVLQALSEWTVPLIALPGNHDQATLDGAAHALVPLALVLPSAYIISEPTLLLNALWIPYRRDQEEVKQAMATMVTAEVGAIFCHVDVMGADMGGGFLCERGLSASDFPAHLPVFTGHYHKSHDVPALRKHPRTHPIRYVGSQYQTTMREAEEKKVMVVLRSPSPSSLRHAFAEDKAANAADGADGPPHTAKSAVWTLEEEVAVEFGVRHFRAKSLKELEERKGHWALRKGDRVQVCVEDAKAARGQLRALEKELQVRLEVREEAAEHRMARVPAADTLDAMSLLRLYFEENSKGVDARVREEAEKLLLEVQEEVPGEEKAARHVVLDSVEIQGFGSFGFDRKVMYPLAQRGVVLVVGKNEDEESSDSNGSGKTTLCMAALWALTGSADVRADGKRLGRRDVVHSTATEVQPEDTERSVSEDTMDEDAGAGDSMGGGKRRKRPTTMVSLCGTVNGVSFEVRRRTHLGRLDGALSFFYDGEDKTRSSMRDTQNEIQRVLPVQVLSDAVFHGQHLVTGLLEKTDKDFKMALDNLIPTEVWTKAMDKARERKKTAKAQQDELAGRIKEKESEEMPMREQLAQAEKEAARWEQEHAQETKRLEEDVRRVEEAMRVEGMVVEECRAEREASSAGLSQRQSEMEMCMDQMTVARKEAATRRAAAEARVREEREREAAARGAGVLVRARGEEMERARGRLGAAEERRAALEREERKWRDAMREGAVRALGEASRAMVVVEAAREELQALLDSQEEEMTGLMTARNASELAFEEASRRAGAAVERVAVAQQRADEYARLKHDPTCRLCLQPIMEGEHAKHLADMQAEVAVEEGERIAAEAARERARSERNSKVAAVEYVREERGREIAHLRDTLKEREDLWRMANGQVSALDGQARSPQHVALEAAREEERRCRAELAPLQGDVERVLGEVLAPEERAAVGEEMGCVLALVEERLLAAAKSVKDAEAKCRAALAEAEAGERGWDERLSALRQAAAGAKQKAMLAEARYEAATQREVERGELAQRLERERERQNPFKADLQRVEAAAAAARVRRGQLEKERGVAEEDGRVWARLEELFGKRGLQNFVYEVAVLDLERRAAGYLELLSDDCLRLELSLGEQLVDRTLLVRSAGGGYSRRSLQQLSGGQWRRLSLALSLAFSQASLERTQTSCNLIVLDEVMQHLDSEGCARVARLLGGLVDGEGANFQTALVILQTAVGEELGDSFDQIDVVVKKGDSSYVRSAAGKIY